MSDPDFEHNLPLIMLQRWGLWGRRNIWRAAPWGSAGILPISWMYIAMMGEQRQRHAFELLCDGSSIKETAFRLGYKQPNNFSRKYKDYWGICPSLQSHVTVPVQIAYVRK
jgi:hypothetical protein